MPVMSLPLVKDRNTASPRKEKPCNDAVSPNLSNSDQFVSFINRIQQVTLDKHLLCSDTVLYVGFSCVPAIILQNRG